MTTRVIEILLHVISLHKDRFCTGRNDSKVEIQVKESGTTLNKTFREYNLVFKGLLVILLYLYNLRMYNLFKPQTMGGPTEKLDKLKDTPTLDQSLLDKTMKFHLGTAQHIHI